MNKTKTFHSENQEAIDFGETLTPALELPAASAYSRHKPSLFGFTFAELAFAALLFVATVWAAGYLVPKPELVTHVPSTVTLSVPLEAAADPQLAPRARRAAAASNLYRGFQDTATSASFQPAPGQLQKAAAATVAQPGQPAYALQGSVGTSAPR
ncbi:hypothetical protein KY386_00785 [Candidatus Parcubacteria bacterium]|nr:hypothetical protein [Candidatus Parcubacteria bacterium]